MPKNPWRLVLKGLGGFLVGLALWGALSEPYTRVLALLTGTVIRLGERPPITTIVPRGTLMIVERSDLRSSAMKFAVESTDITFNVILLTMLFAASRRAVSDRNVAGFAIAAAALVVVHVAAVVSFVESYYVESFGAWSESHYGFMARHLWNAAPYFYSVVGVYGFAIALWWLFRPPAAFSETRMVSSRRSARSSHHARA